MPGETKHGSPNPDESRSGRGPQIECAEFETLLSEAIDSNIDEIDANDDAQIGSRLSQASQARTNLERFDAHRRVCAVCGPLFTEVQAGRQWLRSLEPVDPPTYLVHNILAATSGVVSTRPAVAARGSRTTPLGERLRERWDSFFAPVTAFVKQPRFVMSFGMIFFSFSLALNAAGVKASDVAKIDLRPTALRHAYIDAQVKVVKYYDNIRFVYEIESKLRELKRSNTPPEPGPEPRKEEQKENRKNNNTSGQPDQNQDRNYSQEYDQPVLAALRIGTPTTPLSRDGVVDTLPAVTATTNRRFV
jgi:hypothetical protein